VASLALNLTPLSFQQVKEEDTTSSASTVSDAKRAEAERLQKLMVGYQQADDQATTNLVRSVSPMLLRFLAGPVQTRSQAEDMLQDCWLRIHRARHTFRPDSPVLPWLFAIARHARIDGYRRKSRIDQREVVPEDLEAVSPATAAHPADDSDLWQLVSELPQSQQEVVRMLKVTGMTLEEVANATGVTVGSVKQKAHRAYKKLRQLLEESGGAR